MTTVKALIATLQTLPESWTLHMDSVGNVCISNDQNRIVGLLDIATGEIDRFEDDIST